jgi:hypothetical protein
MFGKVKDSVNRNSHNIKLVTKTTLVIGGAASFAIVMEQRRRALFALGMATEVIKDLGGEPAALIATKVVGLAAKK